MERVISNFEKTDLIIESTQQKINRQQRKVHLLALITFLSACATLCYKFWFKSTPLAGPIATAALTVFTLYQRNVLKKMEATPPPANEPEPEVREEEGSSDTEEMESDPPPVNESETKISEKGNDPDEKKTDSPPASPVPILSELPGDLVVVEEKSSDSDSDSEISYSAGSSNETDSEISESDEDSLDLSEVESQGGLNLDYIKKGLDDGTFTYDEYESQIMEDLNTISMAAAIKKYSYENVKKDVAAKLRDKIADAITTRLIKFIQEGSGKKHENRVAGFLVELSLQRVKVTIMNDSELTNVWYHFMENIPDLDQQSWLRILTIFRINYIYHYVDAFIQKKITYLKLRDFCSLTNMLVYEQNFPLKVRPYLILGSINTKSSNPEIKQDRAIMNLKPIHYEAAKVLNMEIEEILNQTDPEIFKKILEAGFKDLFARKITEWISDPTQMPLGTPDEKTQKYNEFQARLLGSDNNVAN